MRFFLILGALVLASGAAAAQAIEGSDATVGSQWKADDGNLAAYVAKGYRVAGVTQQLTASDRGLVNVTSYFLQRDTSFVRCNELILPPPATPKGKEAPKKPVAPTVVFGCAEAVAPAPVPFSGKPAVGFEGMLPGQ
jgi:hypothetical protein